MKVILLNNIKGIGLMGDIKEVSDGYARNFLLPRGLARLASVQSAKEMEALKSKRFQEVSTAKENAQKVADYLRGISIELSAKASPKGTLFDGIEAKDIVQALKEQKNAAILEDQIKMDSHIKKIGDHDVVIELTPEITVPIKVIIKAK
ncbi:MAG: 50S ribosomal protein L9 [Candidatus Yanofskybacteria bacterium]|nr:50S ribosomal protein L9 [Candidatus Yanofskybacteria bacterium]